jgi:NAD-dependent dihydropyrimidine dehydrogenase PreA subunit
VKEKIRGAVRAFLRDDAVNRFEAVGGTYFDEPLVGFADAEDALFAKYKTLIWDEYLTPGEAFERSFGAGSFHGGSVVSVALPVSEKIRNGNRGARAYPSDDAVRFRSFGADPVPQALAAFLVKTLTDLGYRTVSPANTDGFRVERYGTGFRSAWSERHTAYAAGLGTFSLNDALITERGIAVRFASAVTELALAPDARTAGSYTENCLFCGACIAKCPAGALSQDGHDKLKCYVYCYGEASRALAVSRGGYADAGAGCGLCQIDVPCEFKNPRR